jgi:hypothetical protein
MSYCSTLKTFQVENVLCDEATRMNNNAAGDHEWEADPKLYYDAREVLAGRGLDADATLRERGIKKPE